MYTYTYTYTYIYIHIYIYIHTYTHIYIKCLYYSKSGVQSFHHHPTITLSSQPDIIHLQIKPTRYNSVTKLSNGTQSTQSY